MLTLKFLGAAQNVTGSRFLINTGDEKILVDCGLYQERKNLNKNWDPFPVNPSEISSVFLTHAHLDHSGFLPRLALQGFKGKIFATKPTIDIAKIALLDAAHLFQEDAEKKSKRHQQENRKGPHPEIPLYTPGDVYNIFDRFQEVAYNEKFSINNSMDVVFHNAGHIIGSSMIEFIDRATGKRLVFSGDLGSGRSPILSGPEKFENIDYLVLESTYGDRDHKDAESIESLLSETINETYKKNGNILIPSFAIERTEDILFYLTKLLAENRIPHLLVFLDSPMAINVLATFKEDREFLRGEFSGSLKDAGSPFDFPLLHLIKTVEESKAINHLKGSAIIIAGSGMCDGGRIKHHLVTNIIREDSTILFVGYQAEGTLGRDIVDGKKEVRIFGEYYPVRAKIVQIHGFSAHADQTEIINWLSSVKNIKEIFLVHGEEEAVSALKEQIEEKLKFNVEIADYGMEREIT